MRQFFDPSLLPVATTDLDDGNILYVQTNGLQHYGYPDIIADECIEDGEQLFSIFTTGSLVSVSILARCRNTKSHCLPGRLLRWIC